MTPKRPVLLVFAAAAAFTALLQAFIPAEVFVAGDTGVKALMMHQFARGEWAADLRLQAPPWARALWDAGLYPLTPHHVERMNGRWYIQWALPFPVLTSCLYRVGGYHAALLIPLAATWAVWAALVHALRAMRLGETLVAVALATLAFTTFLSFYSAVYWEHTLSVACAFAGGAVLLAAPRLPARRLVWAALVAAACIFFREELVLLLAPLGAATAWRLWREPGAKAQRARRIVLAGTALVTPPFLYLAWNYCLYGDVRGVHVMSVSQWLDEEPAAAGFGQALLVLRSLVEHAPVILLAPFALTGACRRRRPAAVLFLFVAVAFTASLLAIAPFQGGREWGPRYLLPAVPFFVVAVAVVVEDLRQRGTLTRTLGLGAAALLLGWGAWNETWLAAREVRTTYARRLETLRGVQATDTAVVAVSHPFITQQLVATMPARTFFLAPGAEQMRQLGDSLFDQAIERFLYLCNPAYDCGPARNGEVPVVRLASGRAAVVELLRRGPMGRYMAYDGSIRRYDFARGGRVEVSADVAEPLLARGWSRVRRRSETVPFRWAVGAESCLLLPVASPANLAGTVRARGMRGRERQRLEVRLNGERIATAGLGSGWSDVAFSSHANQWHAGGNTLCLDFSAGGNGSASDDTAAGAVAFVALRP